MRRVAVAVLLTLATSSLFAANTLRVTSAGPVGEMATMAEANEVRVVFSEPMVVVGKIPQPVTAPFFHIDPPAKGTLRWSGTTTLIFTPSPDLPFATTYNVTIDASAKSVAGNTLDQAYRWTFTTPTIKLIATDWYRKGNTATGSVIVSLQFNQPVDPDVVLPHLQLRTQSHTLDKIVMPVAGAERLKKVEPAALQAFDAKWQAASAAASTGGRLVFAGLATDWNRKRFPPSPTRIILETKPGVAPDTWLQVLIDDKLAQSPRNARSAAQTYTVQLEPTFFATTIDCTDKCDPEQRNSIQFRTGPGVKYGEVRKAITITDITDPAHEVVVKPKAEESSYDYPSWTYSPDELGYSLEPGHRYAIRLAPTLRAADGQTLGYTWMAVVENWHKSAFVSFGSGHGVWEASGGSILPFHVRNLRSVQQWLAPLKIDELMPLMQKLKKEGFATAPSTPAQTRKLTLPPDEIAAIGLDLKPAIGSDNLGLAWAAVKPGEPGAKSNVWDPSIVATLVQSTNLGISVKDSPQNTLVLVTRLDDAKPVAGANVSIRDKSNNVVWSGTADANGIAIAPNTDLRRKKKDEKAKSESSDEYEDSSWYALSEELHFIVVAEKDGDVAYVGSDWNEGVTPWEFDLTYDVDQADPQLRGTIFADRGVYKLGEEVHFKAIARADTPTGMKLLAPGTKLNVTLRNSQNQDVDTRTVEVNAWSSAEWTFKLPQEAPLGPWSVSATSDVQKGSITGELLVAAYRRPDFRVDTTLGADRSLAGTKLAGVISARYLFGGAMSGQQAKWTYSSIRVDDVPQKVSDRWPEDRYAFLDLVDYDAPSRTTIEQKETKLDAKGELRLSLDTDKKSGVPLEYRLEGTVTDVTRQQISGRATFRVDPAPWYIGVKKPDYFVEAKNGVDTEIVAAGLDGLATPGVTVDVSLQRIQWTSVRQSEGDGFYGWQSERKEVPAGNWTITTTAQPLPLHIPLPEGGEYYLKAEAKDGEGRTTTTRLLFYALGEGYTAWERYDHNRIDLVPEKRTYKPGDTARIMVKSPWEHATALLTTEREGVRTWTPFELTSSQQTVTVPIKESDIPNVYVSVLLLKGRTKQDPGRDGSDPGKPAYRLGYVELKVEDASKRLKVDVKANRDEFRPASKAKIDVNVRDTAGKASQSEVTLWAVDYGVLSLTAYKAPDVLSTVYLEKALQVANEDSRQRIVSRRVLTPKGASEGGGGGRDLAPGTVRKDFRVLAFWLGSLVTDAKGRAHADVTLPESLTTYRIIAVAADRQSRFGSAESEVRINKPLMLTPSWPRFLAVGDKASFGAVVHSSLPNAGQAKVTIESLDPEVLTFDTTTATLDVQRDVSAEVRFDAVTHAAGTARVRMRVSAGRENDAFEDVIPVRVLVSPESVAAYGAANPTAQETIEIPKDVVPGFGGLRVDLASTQMVGLSEGARYLVEYPYGCAEQRSSRSLALMLVADLGSAFTLPGVDAPKIKNDVQSSLDDLKRFQCGDGGFAFWAGDCSGTSPYLTSYVAHVFQRGKTLGYTVDASMLDRAYTYLDSKLGEAPPENAAWMAAYTSWQAFATKVLAEGGRNVDSHIARVYAWREHMPLFGISFLVDALQAKGETSGTRITDLRRRITNGILPEGGSAHVEELDDPYLLWLWSSNVRSTAIVLGTLVRGGADADLAGRMVHWLMQAREDGRWGNTQENAWAMESLVDYYRKFENVVPDFTGTVTLGGQPFARETFKGRTTDAKSTELTMSQVLAKAPAGQQVPVVFTRDGAGALFYMMRLRYAANVMHLDAADQGFRVERSYSIKDKPATAFAAGDLVTVTLRIRNTKERRFVAVTDPLPAGTEAVETAFATTASELVEKQQDAETEAAWEWWRRGGFDHVERHDDRVNLFATRLSEGEHVFTYLVRATTAGTFVTAPTHVEEMYEPEVFGRTATSVIEVKK